MITGGAELGKVEEMRRVKTRKAGCWRVRKGLEVDQRVMNAVAGSVDMAGLNYWRARGGNEGKRSGSVEVADQGAS